MAVIYIPTYSKLGRWPSIIKQQIHHLSITFFLNGCTISLMFVKHMNLFLRTLLYNWILNMHCTHKTTYKQIKSFYSLKYSVHG